MDTLYWFWPERGRLATLIDDQEVWEGYRRAAAAAGMTFEVISSDDVHVLAAAGAPRVYVRGRLVDPESAAFHNKLYTWPMFQPDVWRFLSTFQAIESAGCCTLIDNRLNLISNDKAATFLHLRDVAEPWLPTLAIPTRDFGQLGLRLEEAGIDYPVVVKPASWASGLGVARAGDEQQLLTLLRVAGAAELTMVVQPCLEAGGGVSDLRVFCADREPVGALRRRPAAEGAVANLTLGGRGELAAVAGELRERACAIAARLDTPWLGIDFLEANGMRYFSEVEIDACISGRSLRVPGMEEVLLAKFRAYRLDFDRWRAGRRRA